MAKINTEYDVGAAFEAIEEELIASMIRNMERHKVEEIKEDKRWSMWQAEQLKSLEEYRKRNKEKFGKEFKEINKKINRLILGANEDGQMDQEAEILKAIKQGLPARKENAGQTAEFFKINDRKLNSLIKATSSDMKKAETAVLRRADDQYRKIIFNAQVYANSGAGTYEKAIDMATKDFLSAGIDCIEYANGSRHTIADYADMAIRTASKRAYLQGEGTKRQEWGVHLVIMNKRGCPCPKCLPFVGKVIIDDVWSGGSKKDGDYPLMSTAIAAGLYHPRCKDSHTTYFPGISTVDGKYSKKEITDLEETAKQESKQQYVKRQEKKFERLSKYSLDSDNQKMYAAKKQQKNTVVNTQKNDIIESDLGIFKSKLRNDKDISKEYYSGLKEKFSHGNKEAKHLFSKYASGETIETSSFEGVAHFNTETKKISMHYKADLNNSRGIGTTYFHEHGHLIDDALGVTSNDKQFRALLKRDSFEYRIAYGKEHNLKTYDKVDKAISDELQDMRKHSAVSDLLDGLTQGNIKGCAGHSASYWKNQENITSEAFAHMFEAQFDEARYAEMKKYFPKSLEYFEKKMKEMAK